MSLYMPALAFLNQRMQLKLAFPKQYNAIRRKEDMNGKLNSKDTHISCDKQAEAV